MHAIVEEHPAVVEVDRRREELKAQETEALAKAEADERELPRRR